MTPKELGITEEQYGNLERLADILETVDEGEFDMGCYATPDDEVGLDPTEASKAECGTVACAAGHLVKIIKPLKEEGWEDFVYRTTGFSFGTLNWTWLFHGFWCPTDNTALGASKRIRYFLEKGRPKGVYAQMYGDTPLCY